MHSNNNEESRKTLLHSYEKKYIFSSKSKNCFSRFVKEKREAIQTLVGTPITTRMLADHLGISYEMFRKIVNMEKPTKKRDCIIAICISLYADADETEMALESYDMPILDYNRYQRDDIITGYLLKNVEEDLISGLQSLAGINAELEKEGLPLLEIKEPRSPKVSKESYYPFPVIDKGVETVSDELLYGDPYNSLTSCYSPDRYDISARMRLGDNKTAQYTLTATQYGDYFLIDRSKDSIPHRIHSLADAGSFQNCFLELQDMIRIEQRKMLGILNDTKNYHQRESAKIIDGVLHVFLETFNYVIPELNEYYLMDYSKGQYTLYIFGKSQFMRYYLSPAKFSELYGMAKTTPKAVFPSTESIYAEWNSAPPMQKEIYKVHERAFCELRKKVDALINALTSGTAHICNVDAIFDNPYEAIMFYDVADKFNCTLDDEFGVINGIGADTALFEAKNGDQIELTIDDIMAGCALGLMTINEIIAFRLTHDSFRIIDLL